VELLLKRIESNMRAKQLKNFENIFAACETNANLPEYCENLMAFVARLLELSCVDNPQETHSSFLLEVDNCCR
jgi:hypothetical protein